MSASLESVRDAWREKWPEALALWSSYARLSEPVWCMSAKDAKREQLTMSFAMIRLTDHAVVLNVEDIAERGLAEFPLEVMGHEIGHHIYCPGDLTDHARMLVRVRRGLPGVEQHAPMIANLYADLFINDRLQRNHGLHLDQIYARIGDSGGSVLWRIYLRMYELLWRLDRGTLVSKPLTDGQEGDARLGARLIRVYSRDWMKGAASFGALCLSYLTREEGDKLRAIAGGLLDGEGGGGELPDGLSEIEEGEGEPVLHPSEDPLVAGEEGGEDDNGDQGGDGESGAANPNDRGGRKSLKTLKNYRGVSEYRELMKQLNPRASEEDVTLRYYRERAMPYLIRFPEKVTAIAQEPEMEGLETWDIGRSFNEVDWIESITKSPHVVPGVTTVARVYGDTPGQDPHKEPFDLYVGIDCSGSMPNPRQQLSYPVLAGFIVALSALRAGARVMVCLSGEPGKSIATDGFRRDQDSVLRLLTQYLGQGYSYGIFRLDDMAAQLTPRHRPVHVLILTDSDIYSSLDEKHGTKGAQREGWLAAEEGLRKAGGGGTMLLHTPGQMNAYRKQFEAQAKKLEAQGWRLAYVSDWEHVLDFARNFARQIWGSGSGRVCIAHAGI